MEENFYQFLKKGGRSANAAERIEAYVQEYERFLMEHRNRELVRADSDDLHAFVEQIEQQPKASAKGHLWGLGYYFEFTAREDLRHLARSLRQERIVRRPLPIRAFRGLNPAEVQKIESVGIKHVQHMLEAGRTTRSREALAVRSGVSEAVILEIVKLADLARIHGMKGIRARLYHDAGVDTLDKLANWEPAGLHAWLVEFVDQTGFDGIAPLLGEVRSSIKKARQLPRIVEY